MNVAIPLYLTAKYMLFELILANLRYIFDQYYPYIMVKYAMRPEQQNFAFPRSSQPLTYLVFQKTPFSRMRMYRFWASKFSIV